MLVVKEVSQQTPNIAKKICIGQLPNFKFFVNQCNVHIHTILTVIFNNILQQCSAKNFTRYKHHEGVNQQLTCRFLSIFFHIKRVVYHTFLADGN